MIDSLIYLSVPLPVLELLSGLSWICFGLFTSWFIHTIHIHSCLVVVAFVLFQFLLIGCHGDGSLIADIIMSQCLIVVFRHGWCCLMFGHSAYGLIGSQLSWHSLFGVSIELRINEACLVDKYLTSPSFWHGCCSMNMDFIHTLILGNQ